MLSKIDGFLKLVAFCSLLQPLQLEEAADYTVRFSHFSDHLSLFPSLFRSFCHFFPSFSLRREMLDGSDS